MDTDIAPTSLASGRTVPIGAECGGGVHDTPPDCAWQRGHGEYVWTPFWFTTSPHHGLVWSYRRPFLTHNLARPPTDFCPTYFHGRTLGKICCATLSGRTIFLSVEASMRAVGLFLPHILAVDRRSQYQ